MEGVQRFWPFLVLLFSLSMHTACAASVKTSLGTINGGQCQGSNSQSFLGIPYAKPPVDKLRFASPEIYDTPFPASGFNATQPATYCIQFGSSGNGNGTESEDCLTLDVYVPRNTTQSDSLPVKVFIFGGSNENGGTSNPTYTGCFAAVNSIFVSINYRLGVLGFMSLKDAGLTGNYGTQDQLLALQWIQDNIAAFGGNPKQVLLFGQSAGALDVFTLASLPQIKSLISASAMESGGGRDLPLIANTQNYTSTFARLLNCSTSDVECLRKATVSQLKQVQDDLDAGDATVPGCDTLLEQGKFGSAWSPVLDGTFLAQQPTSKGVQVPSIFGSNADDGTLFVLDTYRAGIANLTQTDYLNFLNNSFGPLSQTIASTYSISQFNSTPLPVFFAMVTVLTDYGYKCPAYRGLTTAAKNGIDVWTYNFNVTPSCPWYSSLPSSPQELALFGATHTAEIPFVFGEVNNLPLPSGTCSFTAGEKAISSFLEGAWTSTAANGNPAANNNSAWPAWSYGQSLGIKVQDTVQTAVVDYSVCAFWDGIHDEILQIVNSAAANGSQPNATATGGMTPMGATSSATAPTTTFSGSASDGLRDMSPFSSVLFLVALFILVWK